MSDIPSGLERAGANRAKALAKKKCREEKQRGLERTNTNRAKALAKKRERESAAAALAVPPRPCPSLDALQAPPAASAEGSVPACRPISTDKEEKSQLDDSDGAPVAVPSEAPAQSAEGSVPACQPISTDKEEKSQPDDSDGAPVAAPSEAPGSQPGDTDEALMHSNDVTALDGMMGNGGTPLRAELTADPRMHAPSSSSKARAEVEASSRELGPENEVWGTDSEDILCDNFDRLMCNVALRGAMKLDAPQPPAASADGLVPACQPISTDREEKSQQTDDSDGAPVAARSEAPGPAAPPSEASEDGWGDWGAAGHAEDVAAAAAKAAAAAAQPEGQHADAQQSQQEKRSEEKQTQAAQQGESCSPKAAQEAELQQQPGQPNVSGVHA